MQAYLQIGTAFGVFLNGTLQTEHKYGCIYSYWFTVLGTVAVQIRLLALLLWTRGRVASASTLFHLLIACKSKNYCLPSMNAKENRNKKQTAFELKIAINDMLSQFATHVEQYIDILTASTQNNNSGAPSQPSAFKSTLESLVDTEKKLSTALADRTNSIRR